MVKAARARLDGAPRASAKIEPPDSAESALDKVALAIIQGIRAGVFVPVNICSSRNSRAVSASAAARCAKH